MSLSSSYANDIFIHFITQNKCNPNYVSKADASQRIYKEELAHKLINKLQSNALPEVEVQETLELFNKYLSDPYIAIGFAPEIQKSFSDIARNLGDKNWVEFQRILSKYTKIIDSSAALYNKEEMIEGVQASKIYFDLKYELYVTDMKKNITFLYENQPQVVESGFNDFAYQKVKFDTDLMVLRDPYLNSVSQYVGFLGYSYSKETIDVINLYEFFWGGIRKIMLNEFLSFKPDFYFRMAYPKSIGEFQKILKNELTEGYSQARLANWNKQLAELEEQQFQHFSRNNPNFKRETLYTREDSAVKDLKNQIDRYAEFVGASAKKESTNADANKIHNYFSYLFQDRGRVKDEISELEREYLGNNPKLGLNINFWRDEASNKEYAPLIKEAIIRNLDMAKKFSKSESEFLQTQAWYIVNFIKANFAVVI